MISSVPKLISDMQWMNDNLTQVISCKIPYFSTTSPIITQKPNKSSHLAFSFWFFYQKVSKFQDCVLVKINLWEKCHWLHEPLFRDVPCLTVKARHELKPRWYTWIAHLNALWNFQSLKSKHCTTSHWEVRIRGVGKLPFTVQVGKLTFSSFPCLIVYCLQQSTIISVVVIAVMNIPTRSANMSTTNTCTDNKKYYLWHTENGYF